jgi:hypothetical protein
MAAPARVKIIIPTAINLLTAVNEILISQQKLAMTPAVELPSLRRRALLVVNETSSLPITTVAVPTGNFTR